MQTLIKMVKITWEGCHAAAAVASASFTPVNEQNWSTKINTPGKKRSTSLCAWPRPGEPLSEKPEPARALEPENLDVDKS